jgi:hypothetical protein
MVLADKAYLPLKKPDGDTGLSALEVQWYSKCLERMKEPRLPEMAKNKKLLVYRFMILPPSGNPIAVRVQKRGEDYLISAKRLNGKGGYDPGKLVEEKNTILTKADGLALNALLVALRFFEMPTYDGVMQSDGDQWVFEGVSEGRYHVIQRCCASSEKPKARRLEPFVAVCKFLIDKSNLSERPKEGRYELLPIK